MMASTSITSVSLPPFASSFFRVIFTLLPLPNCVTPPARMIALLRVRVSSTGSSIGPWLWTYPER